MTLFDEPLTLEHLLDRIEALEARLDEKQPRAPRTDCPPEVAQAWALWYAYKAGRKGWNATAKKINLKKLCDLSALNSQLAMQIVEASIENGWAGLFAPKVEMGKVVPSAVQTKTVKQAMAPSESKLDRDLAYARQRWERGEFGEDQSAYVAERSRITEQHRRI